MQYSYRFPMIPCTFLLLRCCFVDVIAPPYDAEAGRRCTYYDIEKRPDDSLWARPVQCPRDYRTTNVPYKGLPVGLNGR
jgi:hypothetical protein